MRLLQPRNDSRRSEAGRDFGDAHPAGPGGQRRICLWPDAAYFARAAYSPEPRGRVITIDQLAEPLPQSLEAERSVLGAILLDNNSLDVVLDKLSQADFARREHQKIFRVMIELREAQQLIDLVTLTDYLHQQHTLAEISGGVGYIAGLIDGVPHVTNVAHYARIVKGKALLRGLIKISNAIQKQAFEAAEEPEEILTRANSMLAALQPMNGFPTEPAGWQEMFHSYADFENAPPLSFSINGFLQNDGATMIGGLSGHGKTLVLCSIAKALLAGKGGKLWDLFMVEENCVRILYLIPECSIAPFKHRLKLFGIYDCLASADGRFLVRTLSKGPTPCLSDPRILFAAKGAHVILDTAARFGEGDENSSGDNMRGLANDIFALIHSGARSVIAAHHSPKPFARENVMRLENVLRGSGDIGAMLTTAWGIKQLDADQNIIHIENIKPRDFQPCQPFQIIGRPSIDQSADFALHKRPGECGTLMDEQDPERDRGGGAPEVVREAKAANKALMRGWLTENHALSSSDLVRMFANNGIKIDGSSIRRYRKELEQ